MYREMLKVAIGCFAAHLQPPDSCIMKVWKREMYLLKGKQQELYVA
jgi:hypothetical protein